MALFQIIVRTIVFIYHVYTNISDFDLAFHLYSFCEKQCHLIFLLLL